MSKGPRSKEMQTHILVQIAREGACRNADPDLFFPEHDENTTEYAEAAVIAKAICAGCPVKRECAEHAVRYEEYGIWGEMTPQERRRRRRDIANS